MASNSDYIITIYDVNGDPLPGLAPIWKSFFEIPVGAAISPVVCQEIGGGLYHIPRVTTVDKHYAGVLDFGETAYPRYVTYDSRYEESQEDARVPPYVSFTGGGDTINPVIYKVESLSRNQVRVTFSEPVRMTTETNGALRLSNYSIEGLPLISVQQQAADRVVINTYTQTPGMVYTLTILNVEDLDGNPISPQ